MPELNATTTQTGGRGEAGYQGWPTKSNYIPQTPQAESDENKKPDFPQCLARKYGMMGGPTGGQGFPRGAATGGQGFPRGAATGGQGFPRGFPTGGSGNRPGNDEEDDGYVPNPNNPWSKGV
jgi:hypothetical protein